MSTIVQAHIRALPAMLRARVGVGESRDAQLRAQAKLRLCLMDQVQLAELAKEVTPPGDSAYGLLREFVTERSRALETMPEWIGEIGGK